MFDDEAQSTMQSLLLGAMLTGAGWAQPAHADIRYDAKAQVFRLSGGEMEYDLGIDDQG